MGGNSVAERTHAGITGQGPVRVPAARVQARVSHINDSTPPSVARGRRPTTTDYLAEAAFLGRFGRRNQAMFSLSERVRSNMC